MQTSNVWPATGGSNATVENGPDKRIYQIDGFPVNLDEYVVVPGTGIGSWWDDCGIRLFYGNGQLVQVNWSRWSGDPGYARVVSLADAMEFLANPRYERQLAALNEWAAKNL